MYPKVVIGQSNEWSYAGWRMRSISHAEVIKDRILLLRDQRVMLDRDLAALYGVPTRHLNQQVKRNRKRFPGDFMFQLIAREADDVRVRVLGQEGSWRGKLPYVFTEQGAGMLAAVLRSPTAAAVAIQILRAFKTLRRDEEPSESVQFDRRHSLFAAIRDAVLCCPDDKPFTTEIPCTYFLQAGSDGPIKIGSTRNLVRSDIVCSPPLEMPFSAALMTSHSRRKSLARTFCRPGVTGPSRSALPGTWSDRT